ncbi:RadC family protein [Parabacteroides sp. AM08-6]|uniref:JAB domain-containing protein n=1 Tax=Parabacteroides sp. AM08-6 TaxID=2292053 RepID=UPI000EFFD8E0|nr:JAB domain-containing protein [Parabacteroides sp. AM08-6]RHJ83538.1 hypothetical protein DW103_07375 [Parabacteroides sp. AM08-6]
MTTLFGEQINTLNSEKIYNHLSNGEYSSVSDVELVYSIVGDEELAARVYQTAGKDWSSLFKYSVDELMKIPGIGKKRAIQIVAAMEMGRRKIMNRQTNNKFIYQSSDLYEEMSPILCDLPHEELWIVLVNSRKKIIAKAQISKGGRNETSADITLILKKAIEKSASGIFLCHNHPSGNLKPSIQDNALTQRLRSAAKLVDIQLVDHVIITDEGYYSYSDEGNI